MAIAASSVAAQTPDVALVAKDGKIILSKGYGLSNRALSVSMQASSVVQIGSNTKDFTRSESQRYAHDRPTARRRPSDATHLVIVARAGNDDELILTYEVEAAAPHRLVSLRIESR